MELPKTSIPAKITLHSFSDGFTLLEMLIAMGLLAVMLTLGLLVSVDFYKSYSLRSEHDIIVSMLQKARSQSLNNINQKRHGVRFFLDENSGTPSYTLFECDSTCTSWTGPQASDLTIPSQASVAITNPLLPFDVVFQQLSGDCASQNCAESELVIHIEGQQTSGDISINPEGAISW